MGLLSGKNYLPRQDKAYTENKGKKRVVFGFLILYGKHYSTHKTNPILSGTSGMGRRTPILSSLKNYSPPGQKNPPNLAT
jgi:hypothetical protein